jgi:hypothetical protein
VRFPQPNIQLQARFLLSNKSPPEHPTKKHLRLFPFKIPGRASKVFGNSRFSSTPTHPQLHSFKNQQHRKNATQEVKKASALSHVCGLDAEMHIFHDTPHALRWLRQ